ncbi:MAG: GDSL-type esterase/lipase family protein [Verrucomicrobiaceae bacterium]
MSRRHRTLAGYLVINHLLLALVLWKSDFLPRLKSKLTGEHPNPHAAHYQRMVSYHRQMDPAIPDQATIFLGDSITQGLCVSAVTPLAVNYGIGGDTTSGLLDRLPHYPSLARAKTIVLAIGINDMHHREDAATLQNIKTIRASLPPNTPVLISGILPLDPSAPGHPFKISTSRITTLNQQLATFADATPHTGFLPPSPQFTDQNGLLLPHLHLGDGLHLNPAGYQIWISALRSKLLPTTNTSP